VRRRRRRRCGEEEVTWILALQLLTLLGGSWGLARQDVDTGFGWSEWDRLQHLSPSPGTPGAEAQDCKKLGKHLQVTVHECASPDDPSKSGEEETFPERFPGVSLGPSKSPGEGSAEEKTLRCHCARSLAVITVTTDGMV
jgi:hypothetical protein